MDLVNRVAKRLVEATGNSGPSFQWEVSVVRSPTANAFCLPGGKIVVYTGILPVARDEAGLATVMGHEMAHATSQHGAQQLFQSQVTWNLDKGAQMSVALGNVRGPTTRGPGSDRSQGQSSGNPAALQPGNTNPRRTRSGLLATGPVPDMIPAESISFWQRMSESARGGQPPGIRIHASLPRESDPKPRSPDMTQALQEYDRAKSARR